MTELLLYKFITENSIEFHWHDEDVIVFISCRDIVEWNELIPGFFMEEQGFKCTMKSGYFCFWMKDLCEHCDIEMTNVFLKDK